MTGTATPTTTTRLVATTGATVARVLASTILTIIVDSTDSIVWTRHAPTKIHLRTRTVPVISTGSATGGATPLKPTIRLAATMGEIVARVPAWMVLRTLAALTALIATTQPV